MGPVELLPAPDCPGHYVLHEDSKRRLQELGCVPIGEKKTVISPQKSVNKSFGEELEEGYYEVEEVLERRLRNDMTYEFKVRFKGYVIYVIDSSKGNRFWSIPRDRYLKSRTWNGLAMSKDT